jgi:hypothetical protein
MVEDANSLSVYQFTTTLQFNISKYKYLSSENAEIRAVIC